MPTEQVEYKPSEEIKLSSLVINEVDSNETFEKMKEKGLLQDNQLYLITDEQGSGSADFVIEQNKRLEQKFWRGTKAEFNAVETKSDDTMYIIVDDNGTIVEPGGMQPSVYDPQGRATDIFAYVDERVSSIPTPDVSSQINAHNTNLDAHSDIRGLITSKINVADIINNLTTNASNKPLSAAQGVALKEMFDAIPAWAKAANKPTYTAEEVSARPDTWMPTAAQVGAATEEYVNQAIQTAIGNAIGGSY